MSTPDYASRIENASDQKARLPFRDVTAMHLNELNARRAVLGGLIGSQGLASPAQAAALEAAQLAHNTELRRDAGLNGDANVLAKIEETPLWQAQMALDKAITVLEKVMDGLAIKMQPLLRQMPVANAPDAVPAPRPPGASEVAGNLFTMGERLFELGRRVEELRERCDV